VRTFFGQDGFFRCGRPHFLVQKHWIFRNLLFVRTDKGGWGLSQYEQGGRGQFFAILCGSGFERPLSITLQSKTFAVSL